MDFFFSLGERDVIRQQVGCHGHDVRGSFEESCQVRPQGFDAGAGAHHEAQHDLPGLVQRHVDLFELSGALGDGIRGEFADADERVNEPEHAGQFRVDHPAFAQVHTAALPVEDPESRASIGSAHHHFDAGAVALLRPSERFKPGRWPVRLEQRLSLALFEFNLLGVGLLNERAG